MRNANVSEISCGKFKDKFLEKDFFEYEISSDIKYIRALALVLGIIFMLFFSLDYIYIKNGAALHGAFFIRVFVLLLCLVIFISKEKLKKNHRFYTIGITSLEAAMPIAFTIISYFYEFNDIKLHAIRVVVILFVIHLAPNQWLYMTIASIITSATFVLRFLLFPDEIRFFDIFSCIIYIIIATVASCVYSYRVNYFKRIQYIDRLKFLAMSQTDSLTGIYNRWKFNDELTRWIGYSKRYKTPLSLVIFDLDDFKQINDQYGHLVGDKVIVNTSQVISKAIRQSDVFARWGGEEFVLLLPHTDIQQAWELAERIRKLVAENTLAFGKRITCSFGLVSLREDDTEEILLHRADRLLYEAKKAGKNTIVSQK